MTPMTKIVPYVPEHFEFIEPHEKFTAMAAREDGNVLAMSKEAWTFLDDAGNVIAIIGAMETHKGVAYLWSIMSTRAGAHMTAITRFAIGWLERLGMVRYEATVLKDFKEAHRWMRMLGFKKETTRPMKRWDGHNDFHLYARV